MPNYVTNNLELIGDEKEVKRVLEELKSQESDFDFEKIYPMPEELRGTDAVHGKPENELLKMIYGADDWYKWRLRFWGTKWNASDVYTGADTWGNFDVQFTTAWSTPEAIFYKLSQKYPHIEFRVEFADEDLGSNCGILTFKHGQEPSWIDMSLSKNDQETAIRFALKVRYGTDADYEDIVSEYEEDED